MKVARAVAAVLVAIPAIPASADQPLSDWKIEPSDARCVAVRQYGSADRPTMLALKAPPENEGGLQVAVIRDGFVRGPKQAGAKVTIDRQEFETHALGYPVAGQKKRMATLFNLSPEASSALRKASDFSVNVKGSVSDSFVLSPSGKLWTEIDACVVRLKSTWNIGDGSAAKIAQDPRALEPLQGLFSPEDYPSDAYSARWSGTTHFLLLIDEKGLVKDCTLIATSGMAVIDSRSCGIVTRKGKFAPAIGIDGKPVKSAWSQRVTWRLAN